MALRKVESRQRRHARVRKSIGGTAERPRLAVFRSNRHIYAQVIDDVSGRTLAAASTLDDEAVKQGKKADIAKSVGELIGKRAKQSGIDAVVFDRGGYQYHGRVRQVAEGAREAGLTL
jgi:large subunit ribosomal protein L18